MDFVKLTHDPIDLTDMVQSVNSPKCGAISTFIGTTRDNFEGKKVVCLEYEAYESMAIEEMKRICVQVRDKWQLGHIAVTHRLGTVPIGEASVIVAISSEHRKASLEAVQATIDALKAVVPIWKKEVYEDGNSQSQSVSPEAEWKANKECFWGKKEQT